MRDNGGHAVALKWSMQNVYGVGAGEVFWAASDIGWVVGHSYIVYAPLLKGCTSILYEGKPVGTPDPGAFWRLCAQHGVNALFTAPTAFRAIKKEDPEGRHMGKHDLSRFRTLFLAGERCDPDTLLWARERLGVPVIDHWWQTETGLADRRQLRGAGHAAGQAGLAHQGRAGLRRARAGRGQQGDGGGPDRLHRHPAAAAARVLPTLWNNDAGYESSYLSRHPGYYLTADAGYKDEDGYLYVMSRVDDIINVAGHRLSTGAMEEVLAGHRDVAECAVVGVADEIKGEVPVGFVVTKAGVTRPTPTSCASWSSGCASRSGRWPPSRRPDRQAPAQDAVGQDPARHHEEDRGRPGVRPAGHHRRPRHPERDHRRPQGDRLPQARLTMRIAGALALLIVLTGCTPAFDVSGRTWTKADVSINQVTLDETDAPARRSRPATRLTCCWAACSTWGAFSSRTTRRPIPTATV